jgi:hypothetical protein
MTTSHKDNAYLSAVSAELESISDPFHEHLQKLDEVINRSERDGLCSAEAAEAARDKIYECIRELETLFVKTYDFHEEFRVAETFTALLTREQMLMRLNELGYPLTATYLNKISGRSGGDAGPPIAKPRGTATLYRLDEAIAWANSHFSSAPGARAVSRVA